DNLMLKKPQPLGSGWGRATAAMTFGAISRALAAEMHRHDDVRELFVVGGLKDAGLVGADGLEHDLVGGYDAQDIDKIANVERDLDAVTLYAGIQYDFVLARLGGLGADAHDTRHAVLWLDAAADGMVGLTGEDVRTAGGTQQVRRVEHGVRLHVTRDDLPVVREGAVDKLGDKLRVLHVEDHLRAVGWQDKLDELVLVRDHAGDLVQRPGRDHKREWDVIARIERDLPDGEPETVGGGERQQPLLVADGDACQDGAAVVTGGGEGHHVDRLFELLGGDGQHRVVLGRLGDGREVVGVDALDVRRGCTAGQ